jgi:hypothetical protein
LSSLVPLAIKLQSISDNLLQQWSGNEIRCWVCENSVETDQHYLFEYMISCYSKLGVYKKGITMNYCMLVTSRIVLFFSIFYVMNMLIYSIALLSLSTSLWNIYGNWGIVLFSMEILLWTNNRGPPVLVGYTTCIKSCTVQLSNAGYPRLLVHNRIFLFSKADHQDRHSLIESLMLLFLHEFKKRSAVVSEY